MIAFDATGCALLRQLGSAGSVQVDLFCYHLNQCNCWMFIHLMPPSILCCRCKHQLHPRKPLEHGTGNSDNSMRQ